MDELECSWCFAARIQAEIDKQHNEKENTK